MSDPFIKPSDPFTGLRIAVMLEIAERIAREKHGGDLTLLHTHDGWIAMFKVDPMKTHEIKPIKDLGEALIDLFTRKQ